MNSLIRKRSVTIDGHKTSVSLEDAFWSALREIAMRRGMTPAELVTSIDMGREQTNLSSCLRLFVLNFYVNRLESHRSALDALKTLAERLPRSGIEPSREASVATTNKVDGEIPGAEILL